MNKIISQSLMVAFVISVSTVNSLSCTKQYSGDIYTRKDMSVWGKALLGYDSDVGYTYSSRISTLPKAFNATGQFDAANRTFTFTSQGDRMVVRFETPDRFTLETFDGSRMIESYRFTRS